MSFMMLITIAAVFMCVACLVGGVAVVLRGDPTNLAEDRLQMLTGQSGAKKGGGEGSLLAGNLGEHPDFAHAVFARAGNFSKLFEQADTTLTPAMFLMMTGGLLVGGTFISMVFGLPFLLAPVVGLLVSSGPYVFILMKRAKRMAAFGKQLPDALELVSRALRAGHSLGAAFNLVATEMADPIRKEFHRCYEEQNLGQALEDTLERMTDRVPNVDLRFFATAVILQRQTGGDLAEILDKIGYIVRERFKIWGQVQALTGEGRLSGIVLLALPPVLFVVMYSMNPQYCMMLFNDEMGQKMLVGAIIMQIVGALVIKKIVNIKV